MAKNSSIAKLLVLSILSGLLVLIGPAAIASCGDYAESTTPACISENLADAAAKRAAEIQKFAQDKLAAEEAAKANAEKDYIANGSRPCSLYPASITPACVSENLIYEEAKKVEISALISMRAISTKSLVVAHADNGSLVISAIIPKGFNLLVTTIKLLNNKGKVVDTGVIKYESSGKPYFVFDNFNANGTYKIELSTPKKKAAIISVKL